MDSVADNNDSANIRGNWSENQIATPRGFEALRSILDEEWRAAGRRRDTAPGEDACQVYLDILKTSMDNLFTMMGALVINNHASRGGTLKNPPIYLLPPEILTKIFELVFPARVSPQRSSFSPLGLSHVCRTWRSHVLSAPRLWNQLHLDLFRHSRPHVLPELITSWFIRTKDTRPLVFSLKNHISPGRVAENITLSIIPFLDRMVQLNLINIQLESVAILLSLASGRLPMLEILILDCDEQFDKVFRITVFSTAPRLRVVSLGSPLPTLAHEFRFAFPWAQLTALTMQRPISLQTFSYMLFQSSRLRVATFTITDSLENVFRFDPPRMHVLSELLMLTIILKNFNNLAGLTHILSRLHFPVIENIAIQSNSLGPFPLISLQPRRTETLSSIRTIEIYESFTAELELLQFISACPFLERLVLLTQSGPSHISLLRSLRLGMTGIESRIPFLYLRTFEFLTKGWDGVHLVVEEFVLLVLSWVKDTSRGCELARVSLVVHDGGDDVRIMQEIHMAMDNAQRELGPWIRAEEGSGRTTGLILNTRVVTKKY